ncbi:MAG: hypothetical protein QXT43_02525 [Candidatus Micrarchaeaceae archaeon]
MILGELSKRHMPYEVIRPAIPDGEMLKIAAEKWNGKKDKEQFERYVLACAMRQLFGEVDYCRVFGSKLEEAKKYCNWRVDVALSEKGIGSSMLEKLDFEAKLRLLAQYECYAAKRQTS